MNTDIQWSNLLIAEILLLPPRITQFLLHILQVFTRESTYYRTHIYNKSGLRSFYYNHHTLYLSGVDKRFC